jgi:hypothetical protein
MPRKSLEERALFEALGVVPTSTTLAPGPPSERGPRHSSPKAALRHCCAAWQRAFDAYMSTRKGDNIDRMFATTPAAEAYCNAMPMLDGYDGVCAFIACTAHGILIGAIPKERGGQLLYAAQVALATVQKKPKPPASAPSDPPPPPDQQYFLGQIPTQT